MARHTDTFTYAYTHTNLYPGTMQGKYTIEENMQSHHGKNPTHLGIQKKVKHNVKIDQFQMNK